MLKIRKAHQRGYADHGWLKSWHTFSFANYYDPQHVRFGHLRVINDDRVAGGGGFGTHPHRDMEIITYVLEGALEHRDSMGNGSTMRPGDVQRMSAGTGVTHSEFNHSRTEEVHFLQIWIVPDRGGYPPGYEQIRFDDADKRGKLKLIASPGGSEGSVSINQDLRLYAALLDAAEQVEYALDPARQAWVQIARGSLQLNGETLGEGDGAAITGGGPMVFSNGKRSEFLLFDMPKAA